MVVVHNRDHMYMYASNCFCVTLLSTTILNDKHCKSSDASFIIEDNTCKLLDGKITLHFLKIPRHTKVAKNDEQIEY